MKKLTFLLVAMTMAFGTMGQVEMGKTKNTIMGKGKLVALPMDRVMIDNFSINLILYGFAEDQGGNRAQVGIRADLTEIDEALAQEIVNEAYAYFEDQWKQRGVELFTPSVEEIKASKKYSKADAKGKGTIYSGGTWDNHDKKTHVIYAWPEDANLASSGSGPTATNGNAGHLPPDYKGEFFYTSFSSSVNFISFKTQALGSTASVKAKPQLVATNSMNINKWQKTKVGGYIGGNEAKGIEDFYDEQITEDMEALNSQLNMWNYVGNKTKYKANVMEMIKKGMDDMFADYEAVVAKNMK